MQSDIRWPDGKNFAFTIFDDTDRQTVENTRPVYQLLKDQGLRTTKSVWPIRGDDTPLVGGDTCENPDYLTWARQLQRDGFEIAIHNVAYHTSLREETLRGLDLFRDYFGQDPASGANHTGCLESIYWGDARLTGINAMIYNLLSRGRGRGAYRGHVEGSPLFWGDLCKERIKYYRNFITNDINTLKFCSFMPYRDRLRPYVNRWFASSEGPDAESFVRTISEENQDRLESERGACIMYTHFGKKFYQDGALHPRFKALIERLSKKNGWFVPVTTLLDYLRGLNGDHEITNRERNRLERRWLWFKARVGGTS